MTPGPIGTYLLIRNPRLENRTFEVDLRVDLWHSLPRHPAQGLQSRRLGSLLEKICGAVLPKKFMDSSPSLVNALKSNNETLQNIDRQFIQIMSRYHIYFFHESLPTDFKATRAIVRLATVREFCPTLNSETGSGRRICFANRAGRGACWDSGGSFAYVQI